MKKKLAIFLVIWLPIQFVVSYWLGANFGSAVQWAFIVPSWLFSLVAGAYVGFSSARR